MGKSLLAEVFPVDEKITPITTPEDVVSLAHDLLKQDGVIDILKRVGEHDDFTDDEKRHVHNALITAGERFKKPGHHWMNLNISIALTRKLVSGSIQTDDMDACLAFAADKIRTFRSLNDLEARNHPLRMSEIIQFLRNLKKRPDILDPLIKNRNMEDGKEKDEHWEKIQYSVEIFCLVEGWKYGLANRYYYSFCKLNHIASHYTGGNVPSLEEDVVLAELRKKYMSRGATQYIIDDLTEDA